MAENEKNDSSGMWLLLGVGIAGGIIYFLTRKKEVVITHKECVAGNCVNVNGQGQDQCISNNNCRHKACRNGFCTTIYTPGDDECGLIGFPQCPPMQLPDDGFDISNLHPLILPRAENCNIIVNFRIFVGEQPGMSIGIRGKIHFDGCCRKAWWRLTDNTNNMPINDYVISPETICEDEWNSLYANDNLIGKSVSIHYGYYDELNNEYVEDTNSPIFVGRIR